MNLKEKAKEIRSLVAELNKKDENWKWKVKTINKRSIKLYWEYLEYMGAKSDTFTIQYDPEMEMFIGRDQEGDFLNWDLEDTTTLEGTIKSVYYYARSRY